MFVQPDFTIVGSTSTRHSRKLKVTYLISENVLSTSNSQAVHICHSQKQDTCIQNTAVHKLLFPGSVDMVSDWDKVLHLPHISLWGN